MISLKFHTMYFDYNNPHSSHSFLPPPPHAPPPPSKILFGNRHPGLLDLPVFLPLF